MHGLYYHKRINGLQDKQLPGPLLQELCQSSTLLQHHTQLWLAFTNGYRQG